ncbi:hypothetical protein S420910_103 [Synechococcus phage S-CAM7]|uniref:Uncharacterized protein n=1 Tax=Synechococcus phage S-CAM7 TaxID=1883368 RepID=A0A1D8KUI6_9CAUD|nr:hypothetical protein S420910_103 [Synechococcus phage S-CAM7]
MSKNGRLKRFHSADALSLQIKTTKKHKMISTQITITIKRSEWECYIDTPDSVIETINNYFAFVLQSRDTALEAQAEIFKFMCMFSEFGFYDSEPRQCATDTINDFFGTSLSRWDS